MLTDACAMGMVDNFINFCREYLNGDRPVTVSMVEDGLALRLQSGLDLPIAEVPKTDARGGAISVTQPKSSRYSEYGGPGMQTTSKPIEITDGGNIGQGLPTKKNV